MEANGAQADPLDYGSRLPPRKRLLAGLKKQSWDCASSSPPLSFNSSELHIHFRDLSNSRNLSPEEIVEASRSAAVAAAEVAAAAKATALQKAAKAAKAQAFAMRALELVVSTTRNEAFGESSLAKNRNKKKHATVELLYNKTNGPVTYSETDEELARRLHRAMNSSPRISRKFNKKQGTSGGMSSSDRDVFCNWNSTSLCEGNAESSDGNFLDTGEVKAPMCSTAECLEKQAEASDTSEKYQFNFKSKSIGTGKRGRSKQKKLPLSQCCMRDREDHREMPPCEDCSLIAEPKSDATAEDMPLSAPKSSKGGSEMLMEDSALWKCKKLKVSQCYSESKTLRVLCPIPGVTTATALVKVD